MSEEAKMSGRIILYGLETAVLLVEAQTGVGYLNQVGGQLCIQAEIEAALVPLEGGAELFEALDDLAFPMLSVGIGPDLAGQIDLIASRISECIVGVDQSRLEDSCEAWVHVLVNARVEERSGHDPKQDSTSDGAIQGFGAAKGVLTWPNSD